MKINEIFNLKEYEKAYDFISQHQNMTIKDLGNNQFQIISIPEQTQESKQQQKRIERDNLLISTDKYMLSDFPINEETKQKYKIYRQYLRDFTKQNDFYQKALKTFNEFFE